MTIDFMIRWKAIPPDETNKIGRIVELYVNNREGQPVPFTGTEFNVYNQEQVDSIHELTLNTPQGSIVEYGYDYEREILIPVRVRTDKTKPNREDIAMSNWDWIHNPIEQETMTGESLKLVWRYHNRIKRAMFRSVTYAKSRAPINERPTLLDIGSGVGGDVSKWIEFSKIVAVEPNLDHIPELYRRATLHGYDPVIIFPELSSNAMAIGLEE